MTNKRIKSSTKNEGLNGMADEVLNFLANEKLKKIVRCQGCYTKQTVGYLCNYCGEFVRE